MRRPPAVLLHWPGLTQLGIVILMVVLFLFNKEDLRSLGLTKKEAAPMAAKTTWFAPTILPGGAGLACAGTF